MNNLLQIREKIKRTNRLYEAQLLQLKMEKSLHIEDQSLRNESGKLKKKWYLNTLKIKFLFHH